MPLVVSAMSMSSEEPFCALGPSGRVEREGGGG